MVTKLNSLADYKRALLLPLAAGLLTLLLVVGVAEFLRERGAIDEQRSIAVEGVKSALKLAIDRDSDKLSGLLELLTRNADLQQAFVRRDFDELRAVAQPYYAVLRARHNITHFYFIAPDRRMFLRVQAPERRGDEINRYTLSEAERTGKPSAGLELGPMGIFTLRVVHPWTDTSGQRIGYIELGIEIDRTLEQLHSLTGVSLYSLVEKKHVQRERWEAGMRMIGRNHDWDRFPDHVVVGRPEGSDRTDVPHRLLLAATSSTEVARARVAARSLVVETTPLSDASGRSVGRMLLVMDVSASEDRYNRAIALLVGAGLLIGLGTLLIADRVITHVYLRLNETRQERDDYLERAERDALTGLLRQDVFMRALHNELQRIRHDDSTSGLLMIDIDFFKRVNDTYGHRSGDHVLQSVARLIRDCVRPQDLVARYGGEEFTVILPGAGHDTAWAVAERIRSSVEQFPFLVDGTTLKLTLSIGISIAHGGGTTTEALIRTADRALYDAKNSGRNRIISHARS